MDRLPIALHLTQDLLPIGSNSSSSSHHSHKPPSHVIGSGSGYGPPLDPSGTPLSRLVSQTLYIPPAEPTPSEAAQGWTGSTGGKTEYDLVCLPLTNGNWQERWEGMCTITSSATEADLLARGQGGGGQHTTTHGLEEAGRVEAENWRAGGGFRRNEVNLTRSGTLPVLLTSLSVCSSPACWKLRSRDDAFFFRLKADLRLLERTPQRKQVVS